MLGDTLFQIGAYACHVARAVDLATGLFQRIERLTGYGLSRCACVFLGMVPHPQGSGIRCPRILRISQSCMWRDR